MSTSGINQFMILGNTFLPLAKIILGVMKMYPILSVFRKLLMGYGTDIYSKIFVFDNGTHSRDDYHFGYCFSFLTVIE